MSSAEDLARATPTPSARLLAAQLALVRGDEPPSAELADLAESWPGYASAWLTLSASAELDGARQLALSSARRGAELWDARPWRERLAQLEARWIAEPIATADQLLLGGEAERALETIDETLALEPSNHDASLVKARALLALDRADQAEQILSSMPEDPQALLLAGRIAEKRRDWLTAMALYESLPPSVAERDEALHRSRLQWRLSNLPDYVHEALVSPELSRAQLAILLVALAPQLETAGAGPVPLLTDVVDLPFQREIVTAVRAGLIDVDRLERRFYPAVPATQEQVRQAVQGVGRLLGVAAPRWCEVVDDLSDESDCLHLAQPVTGEWLAGVILEMLAEEAE